MLSDLTLEICKQILTLNKKEYTPRLEELIIRVGTTLETLDDMHGIGPAVRHYREHFNEEFLSLLSELNVTKSQANFLTNTLCYECHHPDYTVRRILEPAKKEYFTKLEIVQVKPEEVKRATEKDMEKLELEPADHGSLPTDVTEDLATDPWMSVIGNSEDQLA